MVLRLTLVKIYICSLCLLYMNCLFICSMLVSQFILNGIVEIALVCPMPMEEDLSTIVLDDDE